MRSVFALTIHADYRCRQSGACCASDWDVPVELPIYRSLDSAIAAGRLEVPGIPWDGGPPLVAEEGLPEEAAAIASRTGAGTCVFHHGTSGLCTIHRDLGHTQLPLTCQAFPRLALRDARGTSITLTHYCPTAADLLFRDEMTLAVVEAPPAFPPGDYDGLDVDADAWPPLLHPRMLMDMAGYAAWERHMVARCAEPAATPETVLATLERDARQLRAFRPGAGSLADAVAALPATLVEAPAHESLDDSLVLAREIMAAVPEEWRPVPDEEGLAHAFVERVRPAWADQGGPLRRYVAAKAFASWTAYQGRGVLSIVRGLEAAVALVRVEATRQCRDAGRRLDAALLRDAIRRADFVLNHLAGGEELADAWSRAEL